MQQNAHHFQMHMKHSLGWITCQATKQFSVNLRKLKPHQASLFYHNSMRLDINDKNNSAKTQECGN